jgi:hypothetical protein
LVLLYNILVVLVIQDWIFKTRVVCWRVAAKPKKRKLKMKQYTARALILLLCCLQLSYSATLFGTQAEAPEELCCGPLEDAQVCAHF